MTARTSPYRVHVDPDDNTVDVEVDQPDGNTARIVLTVGAQGHYGMTINDPRVAATTVIKDGMYQNGIRNG